MVISKNRPCFFLILRGNLRNEYKRAFLNNCYEIFHIPQGALLVLSLCVCDGLLLFKAVADGEKSLRWSSERDFLTTLRQTLETITHKPKQTMHFRPLFFWKPVTKTLKFLYSHTSYLIISPTSYAASCIQLDANADFWC